MNTLKRIRPLIIKEFRQIRRDKRSLAVLLVFPAVLVFLIGFAVNFDVNHVTLALYDLDKSPMSREFIRGFSNSGYFDLVYDVRRADDIDALLNEGKARIGIVIPADFSRRLLSNEEVAVQVIVDGSNANTATTAIGYVAGITQDYSTKLTLETFQKAGLKFSLPIDFRPKVWYNPELKTAKYLIPGLIGFILMLTAVISTSLSVVREKERGTLEQMMISPLHTGEIILGKTVPYLLVALGSSVFILLIGFLVFDVAVRGSILWLYAGILLFLLGALGQGLLISSIAETTQIAFMVSIFSSLLPTFLLSGFVFPIRSMPVALQVISNVNPSKFFLIIVRSVILKGVGPAAFWDQLVYLAIFAAFTLGVSSLRLLRRAS
jgi:ABC-2 type transport system permease protein